MFCHARLSRLRLIKKENDIGHLSRADPGEGWAVRRFDDGFREPRFRPLDARAANDADASSHGHSWLDEDERSGQVMMPARSARATAAERALTSSFDNRLAT